MARRKDGFPQVSFFGVSFDSLLTTPPVGGLMWNVCDRMWTDEAVNN